MRDERPIYWLHQLLKGRTAFSEHDPDFAEARLALEWLEENGKARFRWGLHLGPKRVVDVGLIEVSDAGRRLAAEHPTSEMG